MKALTKVLEGFRFIRAVSKVFQDAFKIRRLQVSGNVLRRIIVWSDDNGRWIGKVSLRKGQGQLVYFVGGIECKRLSFPIDAFRILCIELDSVKMVLYV